MLIKGFKFYSICLILQIFLTVSQIAQESSSNPPKTKENADLIHFGDLVEVDVIGSSEFDWRGTLNTEGFLDGDFFVDEPIYALCQTEETVAAALAAGFGKILRNPQVVVKILDRSGRAVSYLYGAVKTPQRFQIERPVRLNELLILAGGIDEKASGEIQILRANKLNCQKQEPKNKETENILVNQKKNGSETLNISISELIKGGTNANPQILNGDVITVTEAEPIYIIGGVANPRKINARSQMTVSRAIASAGGFSKNADLKNITIFRRNKKEVIQIEVDFEKIRTNESADVVLQKFDILEVGENGREKRKFSPIVKVLETQVKPLELPLRIIE
jgi:protein involved in polysaccharide export with SLBB domain